MASRLVYLIVLLFMWLETKYVEIMHKVGWYRNIKWASYSSLEGEFCLYSNILAFQK